ncbi:hypothetical protein AAMO2058_001192800 [Amorphochlora amoebiformis]
MDPLYASPSSSSPTPPSPPLEYVPFEPFERPHLRVRGRWVALVVCKSWVTTCILGFMVLSVLVGAREYLDGKDGGGNRALYSEAPGRAHMTRIRKLYRSHLSMNTDYIGAFGPPVISKKSESERWSPSDIQRVVRWYKHNVLKEIDEILDDREARGAMVGSEP